MSCDNFNYHNGHEEFAADRGATRAKFRCYSAAGSLANSHQAID
jgi:hypothetical protein